MTSISYRIEYHDPYGRIPGDTQLPIVAFHVAVDTGTGSTCIVEVMHNLVRDTYEVEWSSSLFDEQPEALTATIQMVMLAIQEERRVAHD